MCAIIVNAIEKSRQLCPSILDKYMPIVRSSKYEARSMVISYLTTSLREDSRSRRHIQTVAVSSAGQMWPQIGSRAKLTQDAMSRVTSSRAISWLRDCLENHPRCGGVQEVELPTRLLKLESRNKSFQLVITLVVTRGQRGKYATLSHCWGSLEKPHPFTTSRATLEERITGISLEDLPRTFRHAMVITRLLGLTYLWIDSLCILQDSLLNWENESKEMQNVYANAIVNISADSASDSSQGLRRRRDVKTLFKFAKLFLKSHGYQIRSTCGQEL